MNGTLNFQLGLEANGFLNGMGKADVAVGKLGGSMVGAGSGIGRFSSAIGAAVTRMAGAMAVAYGLHAAIQGAMAAVERGGQLFDLSVRSGASVSALYKLEEAFKQIGVESSAAVPMILKLQRAIGSPEGQRALSVLGLSGQALSGMDAAAQIEAVATALGQMDANSQAAAAYGLLGREGAANMLQIARSGGELSDAMRAVAGDAEVWGRNAERFDRLGDAIVALKSRLQTLFANAIGMALEWADIFKKAIDAGRFGELLSATLEAGMEQFTAVFSTVVVELGRVLADTIGNPELWKGIAEVAIAGMAPLGNELLKFAYGMGLTLAEIIPGLSDSLPSRREFAARLDANLADAPGIASAGMGRINSVIGGMGLGDAWARISAAATAGGPAQEALAELIRSLAEPGTAAARRRAAGNFEPPAGGGWQMPVTSIERMGFIFDRGGNNRQDYARSSARSLEKLVRTFEKPIRVTGDLGSELLNE